MAVPYIAEYLRIRVPVTGTSRDAAGAQRCASTDTEAVSAHGAHTFLRTSRPENVVGSFVLGPTTLKILLKFAGERRHHHLMFADRYNPTIQDALLYMELGLHGSDAGKC